MKMYPGEEFKPIPTIKGLQASNYGRIKRGYFILNKNKRYNRDGYEVCYVKETDREMLVHRLVCDAFHHELHTPEHDVVDHIDGNPKNNHADNLEWVSPKINTQRYFRSLDAQERRLRNAASNILVVNYDTYFATVYPSITAASEATGYSPSLISKALRGQRERMGNCLWCKLSEIKGIVQNEEDGIQSGLDRNIGYWAQANFEGYSIKVSDTDVNRSTKEELVNDAQMLREIIIKKLHEGD